MALQLNPFRHFSTLQIHFRKSFENFQNFTQENQPNLRVSRINSPKPYERYFEIKSLNLHSASFESSTNRIVWIDKIAQLFQLENQQIPFAAPKQTYQICIQGRR